MPINEALTDERILALAKNHKCSHHGCEDWYDFRPHLLVEFARTIEREVLSTTAQPVADDAAAQSDERARFEAEMLARGHSIAKDYDGKQYEHGYTNVMWKGWQARSTHPTPQAGAGRAEMDDRIARLREAIEGECDGLAVDYHHARAILEYVDGDAARKGEKQ